MVFASVALALIASQPALGAPTPAPVQNDPAQAQLAQAVTSYRQLQSEFSKFQKSVYDPYCAAHKGASGVALLGLPDKSGSRPAWPAVISCIDGKMIIVKSPLQKPI